jgi:hypothetical protein
MQVFKDHPLMEPLDYCNTILHFGEVNFTSNALDVLDNNVTIVDAAVSPSPLQKPNCNLFSAKKQTSGAKLDFSFF